MLLFFCSALPAWLKIWMRPPPFLFLFFDTRRRSSLIAYRSLRHLTVTHTDTHIRLNQKRKKEAHSSTPPVGGTQIPDEICFQTRTDGGVRRLPEKYARRCGFVNPPPLFFFFKNCIFSLSGSRLRRKWTKLWIIQSAYFYSCQPFRLCRSDNSQQRRCEYSFKTACWLLKVVHLLCAMNDSLEF